MRPKTIFWIIAMFLLIIFIPLVSATHIRVSGFNESSIDGADAGTLTTTNETLSVAYIFDGTHHSYIRGNTTNLTGKRYFEITIAKNPNMGGKMYLGLGNSSLTTTSGSKSITSGAGSSGGWFLFTGTTAGTGNKVNGDGEAGTAYCSAPLIPNSVGTTIMVAVNGSGGIWFGINGTWCNSGNPATNTNPAFTNVASEVFPTFGTSSAGVNNATFLFASRGIDFSYTPPIGYSGWDEEAAPGGPPEINQNSYNMTSEGGEGCINWRIDKNLGCTTIDTTPTVYITTNKLATCAIGISDSNYTDLGASRECDGAGTLQHTCVLRPQDELTQENSFVYIGCKDLEGNQNRTSTSGALRISIQSSDLETLGRNAIESGIQHALGSGYTIYTDQKLYARNSANNQFVAKFDKVVKWLNKIWAFNFLTGNETATSAFNITPVLYVLDMRNSTVNSTVYNLIINTK